MFSVLVTGVGGPLGQAIVKALRASSLECRVVGTDRSSLSVGLSWVDQGVVVHDCRDEEEYLADLRRICIDQQVKVLMLGSESELVLMSRAAETFKEELGVTVIASSPEVLDVALCKFETCEFLRRSGLNFPQFARLDDNEGVDLLLAELGFPLIAKPCRGSGSQGLYKVQSLKDIQYIRAQGTPYVLQEYLQPDEEEYTVASFTSQEKQQVGSICMRRELAAGNTYRAWVVARPEIEQEAMSVVKALGVRGPCNVQLRLTERGPVTFEINPRFSGTTAMRAHFGYNEVEMAIRNFGLNQPLQAPTVEFGTALRFWDECYLRDSA